MTNKAGTIDRLITVYTVTRKLLITVTVTYNNNYYERFSSDIHDICILS